MVRMHKRSELPEISIQEPLAPENFFYSQDHIAFSPFSPNIFNVENVGLLIFLLRASKTPEGIKAVKDLAIKYLESCTRIIEAIQESSAQNWLTALNNQHIAAGIAHRIGLIDDGSYLKIVDHYRSVFDKMLEKAWVGDTLQSVTTLVAGSKTESGATGLGALAVMLKSLGAAGAVP